MTKIEVGSTLSEDDLGNKGKGSYILLIPVPEEQTITVGELKAIHFPAGYYAYTGSALGGFKSRLNHYLKKNQRPRWHIDYLLQKAAINSIIICQTEDRIECTMAQALSHRFEAIPGFGSSDCKCPSHLFFATNEMKREIMTILDSLGMRPRLMKNLSR